MLILASPQPVYDDQKHPFQMSEFSWNEFFLLVIKLSIQVGSIKNVYSSKYFDYE